MSEARDEEKAVREEADAMAQEGDRMEERLDGLDDQIDDAKKVAAQRQDAPDPKDQAAAQASGADGGAIEEASGDEDDPERTGNSPDSETDASEDAGS